METANDDARAEVAGIELPALNDQLPVKVKGDARLGMTLLTETESEKDYSQKQQSHGAETFHTSKPTLLSR